MTENDRVTVLYYDGGESSLDSMMAVFEHNGGNIEFIAIDSADELILKVAKSEVDSIILGSGTQTGEAFELVRRIRQASQVPMVYLTDDISNEAAFFAGKAGINEIVLKGDPEKLVSTVLDQVKEARHKVQKIDSENSRRVSKQILSQRIFVG